ncbi:hypothetical protein HU200_021238 [Digitaria exilis]|uniref:protein-serine/threonine phosphatase n=1 Tax=Digitaria exilis TaxID=1010633 RepID=A0A835F019_9POAL|nr:hypothetical protein HU200_021238 [Digitaria exilis]
MSSSSGSNVPAAAPFSLVWGESPKLYLSYGTAALKGARPTLTDAVAAMASFTALSPPMGLDYFAVFDARRLGAAVAEQLPAKLAGAIAEQVDDELTTENPRFVAAPHDMDGWWRTVVQKAFRAVLEEVAGNGNGAGEDALVAETAVVALVLEKYIVIASSGACKAALCRGGLHVELTPERRVVIPELDVMVVERQAHDEFLILGSGGLWGAVAPTQACAFVLQRLGVTSRITMQWKSPMGAKGSPDVLARELANKAVHAGSKDNISVAIVLFRDFWAQKDGEGHLLAKLAGAIAKKVDDELATENPRFLAALYGGDGWWRTVIREAFRAILHEVSADEDALVGDTAVVAHGELHRDRQLWRLAHFRA